MKTPLVVTLYSKPRCHLCEDLRERLDELAPSLGVEILEVDITGNADLFRRYRYVIPVLAVEGREIARGNMDERDLLEVLRAATSR